MSSLWIEVFAKIITHAQNTDMLSCWAGGGGFGTLMGEYHLRGPEGLRMPLFRTRAGGYFVLLHRHLHFGVFWPFQALPPPQWSPSPPSEPEKKKISWF